jgi:ditrans,polycis-polyprenyl diphosphate synthase
MTAPAPPPDILVRTSGVARLSDFLLWQCSAHTQLQFARACWPEFGLRDLVPVLLDFQRRAWAAGTHSSGAKGTRVLDREAEGLLSAELDDF